MKLSSLYEGDAFFFRDSLYVVMAVNRQSNLRCCKCVTGPDNVRGKCFIFYENIKV